jgi:polysaccharide export outer membrane protein
MTPRVIDVLATYTPRIGNVFADRRPPREIKFGIGDVVSVTIFESAAGGLFIPAEASVRPGNFVSLPNQNVDTKGNISVPYGGAIRAAGRTPSEVQQAIVDALKNRAIEPQAVVALIDQRTSLISVLGDVNTPNRFPANAAGEHVLDAITRAGGPKSQGYDTWVMLERGGRRATAPFGALVYEPSNNIWVHPDDTIYLYREAQTFLAFGAMAPTGGVVSADGRTRPLRVRCLARFARGGRRQGRRVERGFSRTCRGISLPRRDPRAGRASRRRLLALPGPDHSRYLQC